MADFVFSSSHEVYYSNRELVPIADIIESLQALERIVKMCPGVLEGVTSVPIKRIEVYVEELQSGSLLEKVVVRLFFRSEEELDAFIDKTRDKILQPGMPRNVLIGAVLASLIGYGAVLVANSQKAAGSTTITANNNVIINLGAGQVDLTPEVFRAIVESSVTDKKDLAAQSVKFFKPARADSQAAITLDKNDALAFSPAVISATPNKAEFEKQSQVKDLRDVDLHIRATNLDSLKQGWAGLIPGLIDRRVRLQLDPSVNPTDVAGRFQVRADVSIVYKMDKSGKKMEPDYILLREVIK